ncbi:hypothetical protein [Nonomuraea jabiensis]
MSRRLLNELTSVAERALELDAAPRGVRRSIVAGAVRAGMCGTW